MYDFADSSLWCKRQADPDTDLFRRFHAKDFAGTVIPFMSNIRDNLLRDNSEISVVGKVVAVPEKLVSVFA